MTDATITVNGQSITIQLSDEQVKALTKQQIHPILWQPKRNHSFYYVSVNNNVGAYVNDDGLLYYDVFETILQAEEFANYRAALALYKAAIVQFNDGWEVDFKKDNQKKYYLMYDYQDARIFFDYNFYYQLGPKSFYVKSEDFLNVVKNSAALTAAFMTIVNYKG